MIKKMKQLIKKIPGVNILIRTNIWKSFRHKIRLITSDRENTTFTGFLRLPTQFEALSGPVLDFLLSDGPVKPLKIIVLGCSNGSEPYSIASVLKNKRPNIRFTIHAYDIYREIIYKAKSAMYENEEIFRNPKITSDFVNTTFDKGNNLYKIKKEIAEHVSFDVADALDTNLRQIIGTSDIIFAQNFIVHLKPKMAIKAFNNICQLLNPKAALFVDGMDLGLKQKLTRINNLVPLDYKIEEIYNEAEKERSYVWPLYYWSLEPLSTSKKGWQRRYSTIFLKMEH